MLQNKICGMDERTVLENEYYENNSTIKKLQLRNSAIESELALLVHHIKVNCVVTQKGNDYKIQRIVSFGRDVFGKPWVYGYIKKKNGAWGNMVRCLYTEWELKP
jgi:hypothetical protein